MGWTGTHRERGLSDREYFEAEFPTTLREHGRIVACSTKGGVFYAAVENNDRAAYKPGETWALVVLIQRGRGWWNFHYKEMSEESGPYEAHAPASVLDALSPTDHDYATEWRAKCRANLTRDAEAKAVKKGTTVLFGHELSFGDGVTEDTFQFVERSTFRRMCDLRLVRIPSWRKRYEWVIA